MTSYTLQAARYKLQELLNFVAGMALCGLAWNLLFSSGTILLTTLYRPEDAIRIQGANDVVIFGVAGLGSCASGPLYERGGWPLVVGASAAGVALELVVLVGLHGLARHCGRRAVLECKGVATHPHDPSAVDRRRVWRGAQQCPLWL